MNLKMKFYRGFSSFALAVLFIASFGGNALAVDMHSGDLMFVMFGNSMEFIQNLGPSKTLLASGKTTTFSIKPSTITAVAGDNPTKWSLIGFNQNGDEIVLLAGSSQPPDGLTPAQLSRVSVANPTNVTANWIGQNSGDGLSQKLLPASDFNSFTRHFGTDGSLAGSFPVPMEGMLGSVLSIISGDYNTKALSFLGQGVLSKDGSTLTICSSRCESTKGKNKDKDKGKNKGE